MYGLKIRYSTKSAGQVGWSGAQQDAIVVRKVAFSMDEIRTVVHGLVDTARRRLVEDLMLIVPGVGDWRAEEMPRIEIASYCASRRLGSKRKLDMCCLPFVISIHPHNRRFEEGHISFNTILAASICGMPAPLGVNSGDR
jgi:hypothetical protein